MSSKTSVEVAAALQRASALDTLCWVRDRLNAGDDTELVTMMCQREQEVASKVGAAVRNSIEHQAYRMGRSNYHSHLFSIPVLIESDAPLGPDALDLTPVLPLLMRVLRENGLTGRNGMLLNRIVEHSRLSTMTPSDLFSFGREMFMSSMAAAEGQSRATGGRLRALSEREGEDETAGKRIGGGTLLGGHIVGCVYSTRGEETRLDALRVERLLPRMRAVLEFAVSGPWPVRVRLGRPESMCAAIATARTMYVEAVTEEVVSVAGMQDGKLKARLEIDVDGQWPGEHSLRFAMRHREIEVGGMDLALSMHETGVLGTIVQTMSEHAEAAELGEVEISYAAGRTRH